ncbi:hypothetical protein [Pragia fontium]|uniref:Uncharacterized protein n=2 Tax=Pragia fontium TaxID=82985 RepID=A0AAJ5BGF6_9GAMM|nr:hypothetical protein [Pragia fontium]AKJ41937.1 hypothetical protein QQ39_07440 [Pragia fontium]SFC41526.1 hypothetical protein SAMN02745723_102305 [Pragia fontium DSM 5563 = ATCC 49100]SUB82159.1 Uncharacterised protein [Pragia fontium]VEJ54851.1 Uncharacterised protein [Pragia fontium]GKX62043.1 hypothetical protein SOASR032_06120 [Pragia fontium]
MFPINTIYIIFGVTAAIIALALFIVFRKHDKLKKGVPALALFAIAGVYFFFVNHVYIVTDDNQVTEYALIKTSDFDLVNGTTVRLVPETKMDKSWLINNGTRPLKFETVIYGNANENPYEFELGGYKSIGLDNAIDYLFVTPPNSIKIKSKSATKGWLHR